MQKSLSGHWHLVITKAIQSLQDQDLKHQSWVVRWASAFLAVGILERLVQRFTENLKINGLSKTSRGSPALNRLVRRCSKSKNLGCNMAILLLIAVNHISPKEAQSQDASKW